jgi:glucokinase
MEQIEDDVNLQSWAMILAGDIGGTKTLVGLFEPRQPRPLALDVQSFPTTAYSGLPEILEAFYATRPMMPRGEVAAFGVAGPVINQTAQMTNVEWSVDAAQLARAFSLSHVCLLNDLEATAYAVPVLDGDELRTLQPGVKRREGNIGVVAAGTGLGGSLLHRLGERYIPVASEIGHSDFAARTDREFAFANFLRARYGRCEIEHVLCGPGLVNLATFTHRDTSCAAMDHAVDIPREVSRLALSKECRCCAEALEMFVDAYGAVAGNLALIGVTTGGVFIGGGIAPRILPALTNGRLIAAFVDKPPMRSLLEAVPVHVILNADAGLIGAAIYANNRWLNADAS